MRRLGGHSFYSTEASLISRFHANGITWQAPGQATSSLYCTMGGSASGGEHVITMAAMCHFKLENLRV